MTIRIRSTFSSINGPNTNTLFGLLFARNRIQIEYSVKPYIVPDLYYIICFLDSAAIKLDVFIISCSTSAYCTKVVWCAMQVC